MNAFELLCYNFLVLMSIIRICDIIFVIDTYLDPKTNKEITISKRRLNLFNLISFFGIKKGCKTSEKKVFKISYVLSIIAYLVLIPYIICCILLWVFFVVEYSSRITDIILFIFYIYIFIAMIFGCIIAVIYYRVKKKSEKREKTNGMNFK